MRNDDLISRDALIMAIRDEHIVSGSTKARMLDIVKEAPTVGEWVSVKDDEDLISRAAAIAEIEDYIEEYSDVDPETGLHNPKWCAMEEAKDILVKLPAAQTCGWISVKDGLPKEMQDVLLKFPSNMAVGFYVKGGWMVYSGGDWATDICENDEVPQYWMPLPEAPKEVDDERSNGNA